MDDGHEFRAPRSSYQPPLSITYLYNSLTQIGNHYDSVHKWNSRGRRGLGCTHDNSAPLKYRKERVMQINALVRWCPHMLRKRHVSGVRREGTKSTLNWLGQTRCREQKKHTTKKIQVGLADRPPGTQGSSTMKVPTSGSRAGRRGPKVYKRIPDSPQGGGA